MTNGIIAFPHRPTGKPFASCWREQVASGESVERGCIRPCQPLMLSRRSSSRPPRSSIDPNDTTSTKLSPLASTSLGSARRRPL